MAVNANELRKTICNLFELSNVCSTLTIVEVGLNGKAKDEVERAVYDGTSD